MDWVKFPRGPCLRLTGEGMPGVAMPVLCIFSLTHRAVHPSPVVAADGKGRTFDYTRSVKKVPGQPSKKLYY